MLQHFFGRMYDALISFEEDEAYHNQKNELASNKYTVDIDTVIKEMHGLEDTVKERIQYLLSIHVTQDNSLEDEVQNNMDVVLSPEQKTRIISDCQEACKDFKK
jgi:hypothetical protein